MPKIFGSNPKITLVANSWVLHNSRCRCNLPLNVCAYSWTETCAERCILTAWQNTGAYFAPHCTRISQRRSLSLHRNRLGTMRVQWVAKDTYCVFCHLLFAHVSALEHLSPQEQVQYDDRTMSGKGHLLFILPLFLRAFSLHRNRRRTMRVHGVAKYSIGSVAKAGKGPLYSWR